MKRSLIRGIFLLGLMFAAAGWSPPAAAAEKAAWQTGWEKTIAAARREGKVVAYIVWGADLQNTLKKPLKEKFGLDVEYITGRGADTVNKLYPIALSPYKGEVAAFQKRGAPVDWVSPVEGEFISPSGSIAFLDKAPHPNAAKVLVNWLMSREGLTAWSRTTLWMTSRRDVPTDFLPAKSIRDPKAQYVNLCSEEMQLKMIAAMKLAREIYGPLIK